ncbi:DUF5071 domain-containing protein [Paenibacillus illinoisensis]|uniref:DUF5071 domain-containing protein n=1 Tax=Paenibacillus illinoisensis TaxID=59845 RepID=UPI003D971318
MAARWELAKAVEDLLLRFDEELIPHIRNVFNTRDAEWEYFMIIGLMNRLPLHCLSFLKNDLERIIASPTQHEELGKLEDVILPLLEKLN